MLLKVYIKYVLLLIVVGQFISCGQSKFDTTSPELMLSLPLDDQAFITGSNINVQASYFDETSLSSFVIELKSADPLMRAFDTTIVKKVYGQTSLIDIDLLIPLEVQGGDYKLTTYCVDRLNNESEPASRVIKLLNASDSEYPKIDITSLDASRVNVTFKGGNIVFLGEAMDNKELGELFIKLYRSGTDELYNELDPVSLKGKKTHNVGEFIPAPKQAGTFRAEVTISDAVNNRTTVSFDINVI